MSVAQQPFQPQSMQQQNLQSLQQMQIAQLQRFNQNFGESELNQLQPGPYGYQNGADDFRGNYREPVGYHGGMQ